MTRKTPTLVGPRRDAGLDLTDADQQAAVETFTFDVSAGKKLDPATAEAVKVVAKSARQTAAATAPQISSVSKPIPRHAKHALSIAPRFGLFGSRSARAVFGSLLVNSAVLAGMGLTIITSFEHPFDFTLSLSTEPTVADEVLLDEISIEPLDEAQDLDNQLATEVTPAAAEVTDLNSEISLADLTSDSLANSATSDMAAMFASGGGGLAEDVPSGDKLTASFFGTKVDGRRILYVLDNSGGMQDGEFELLVDELLKSVESLTAEQEFYVLFYSDMVYPLFHPRHVERFVPANDRFKAQLKDWLETVEFCMGNTVDQAIMAADQIRPDAVYLLTDGQLDQTRDQRRMGALLDRRGRKYPIHTFGFLGGGWGSKKAEEQLKQVAERNNGTFRAIPVSAEAKEKAKQNPRPYHDKEPGREWGLSVGRGWGRK